MPVLLEVMRHHIVDMLIAFLVWPQPNIIVDLNGNHSYMAYYGQPLSGFDSR